MMLRLLAIVLLGASQAANPASAQPNDTALAALAKKAEFSGSIGIASEFSPGVIRKVTITIGRKKLSKEDKGHSSTHWRWASATKQVIAVLVLQEVEKGTIDLDQPVAKYLPNFTSANSQTMTVRQLLRHQSGLPNPDDSGSAADGVAPYYRYGFQGNRDALTGYCAGPVKGEAGKNWAYNNCDYIVAGALLEAVTGQSWQELVRARIAKPLGIMSLRAYPTKGLIRGGTIGRKLEPPIDMEAYGASGGLVGSIDDLLKFDEALISGKLLQQKELDQLWDGRPELGYIALGQWVFEASLKDCAKPVKLVERRGAIGGVQVRNFIVPDLKAAIVVFTDKSEADFSFGEIWQGSGFSHDVLNAALCNGVPEAK
jgi:D-alanyl-D-alanine carboxypeptidase